MYNIQYIQNIFELHGAILGKFQGRQGCRELSKVINKTIFMTNYHIGVMGCVTQMGLIGIWVSINISIPRYM